MELAQVPFNKPYMTGKELYYIAQAHFNSMLAGDGPFTKNCHSWLEEQTGAVKALLTHSCTAALEMAALLVEMQPGDEVIMPSYTFVSTANAFVLRGAVPVFVDIRSDTLNLDETLIEAAITPRTKAIVAVHYAGVSCEMDAIMSLARKYGIVVIEDAAQALMSKYHGKPLGTIGDIGALSFHETKNVISGEGGCVLLTDPHLVTRAEIFREKGTNRSQYFRGMVDKYTWQDKGSSYLPGELIAAFLWAQLQDAEAITVRRMTIWDAYHDAFGDLEKSGRIRCPRIPQGCQHNAHMFYLIIDASIDRTRFLETLKKKGINAVFHYVPLHSAPGGIRFARSHGSMHNTDSLSAQLVRLPLFVEMTAIQQDRVIEAVVTSL